MKKSVSIFIFLTLVISSLVSAGPVDGVRVLLEGLREVIGELVTFVSDVLWDIDTFDEFLLAKILLMIILYLVIYTVTTRSSIFGEEGRNKAIYIIISASIAILSIRFMPDQFMNFILIQYTTFGITITTLLPLFLFFLFIHQSNGFGPFGRRVGWLLYLLVFLVMWSYRGGDLGEANIVYIIALLFIIGSVLFDRRIHRYFGMSGVRRIERMSRERRNLHWRRELHEIEEDFRNGVISETEYNHHRRILMDRIASTT